MDASLVALLLLFVVLIIASLGWCLLSSCMGQSLTEFWRLLVQPAHETGYRPFREDMWEMEHRRGPF